MRVGWGVLLCDDARGKSGRGSIWAHFRKSSKPMRPPGRTSTTGTTASAVASTALKHTNHRPGLFHIAGFYWQLQPMSKHNLFILRLLDRRRKVVTPERF